MIDYLRVEIFLIIIEIWVSRHTDSWVTGIRETEKHEGTFFQWAYVATIAQNGKFTCIFDWKYTWIFVSNTETILLEHTRKVMPEKSLPAIKENKN